jgi:hypothetical protein
MPGPVPFLSRQGCPVMSRLLLTLAVILLVVVGGMVLLASRAREVPVTTQEKVVSLDNLS